MEFSKCIALNALVKARRFRGRACYKPVKVSFNSYAVGRWAAEVVFDGMIFDDEIQDYLGWALANTRSHFLSCRDSVIVLMLQ